MDYIYLFGVFLLSGPAGAISNKIQSIFYPTYHGTSGGTFAAVDSTLNSIFLGGIGGFGAFFISLFIFLVLKKFKNLPPDQSMPILIKIHIFVIIVLTNPSVLRIITSA